MASLSTLLLLLLLLLLRALSHPTSSTSLPTEETLFPMRQEWLETEARNLRASIGGLSRWFRQGTSQHVVGLAFALWIASPSELHCSDAWTAVALVLMAAGFYLVGFVMLMMRLMQRFAELEAAEGQLRQPLAEVEGSTGRRGGRSRRALYATLAVVYFVLFTVATARISWLLACPDR